MTRDELQGIAAHRLAKEHRLICQWCTGCGKSGIVLRFLKDNPDMDCLILVPEQNNIQNWEVEFDKFQVNREKVTIVCYASFHKYKDTRWDLLVFDESPHVDTAKRRAICDTVHGEYVLALGAVIDEEETKALEDAYGRFEKSYVSLKKAIEWNILPSPTVNVCHMALDDTIRRNPYQGAYYTDKAYYDILQKTVKTYKDLYTQRPNRFLELKMLKAGSDRKRFLGQRKQAMIQMLCNRLDEQCKRFLCFCSSIKQAEQLGGDHAFTSKSPTSMKHLDKFNNHEINSLYVVGKLIEGQNLVDIDCGVIVQLGGTSRITVQEVGRIMRSDKPVIYVPVFDGTKDNSFLYTLTSNIPANYIKHYNF